LEFIIHSLIFWTKASYNGDYIRFKIQVGSNQDG